MTQSELKLILSIETEAIRALANLELSLERLSNKYISMLDEPLNKLDELTQKSPTQKTA